MLRQVHILTWKYVFKYVQNDDKDPKYKVRDHVYQPNCLSEVFLIKKAKNTVLRTYLIEWLNSEEPGGTFYEKDWQKTN